MANKFQFKLLTGANPQDQYDNINPKDAMTFYLLKNGVGYLGEVKLFDANEDAGGGSGSNFTLVTDMTGEDYTGDDETVASTKAIVDFVAKKVSGVNVLSTAFFRKVESHTIIESDLTDDTIEVPEGTEVGDVGLLFTADVNGEDEDGYTKYFISLKNYLQTVYTFGNTNSIKMNVSEGNEVTADLNVKEDEKSIIVDENGVSLNKATVINDGDEEDGVTPSDDKLVTEKAVVEYIKNSVVPAINEAITEALKDVVTYSVDDDTTS